MIQRSYITDWRNNSPWQPNEQVEQDLVISRAIVEIFSDPSLREQLAFRGGTALHKLHCAPAARYSEDIDLVQIVPGAIGSVFDLLRQRLSFLGQPRITQRQRNNTLVFSFESEIPPVVNLKLMVEITRQMSKVDMTANFRKIGVLAFLALLSPLRRSLPHLLSGPSKGALVFLRSSPLRLSLPLRLSGG